MVSIQFFQEDAICSRSKKAFRCCLRCCVCAWRRRAPPRRQAFRPGRLRLPHRCQGGSAVYSAVKPGSTKSRLRAAPDAARPKFPPNLPPFCRKRSSLHTPTAPAPGAAANGRAASPPAARRRPKGGPLPSTPTSFLSERTSMSTAGNISPKIPVPASAIVPLTCFLKATRKRCNGANGPLPSSGRPGPACRRKARGIISRGLCLYFISAGGRRQNARAHIRASGVLRCGTVRSRTGSGCGTGSPGARCLPKGPRP